MKLLKSIGACALGIFVGVVLSVGTDKILENTGVLPHGNLWVSNALIAFVPKDNSIHRSSQPKTAPF